MSGVRHSWCHPQARREFFTLDGFITVLGVANSRRGFMSLLGNPLPTHFAQPISRQTFMHQEILSRHCLVYISTIWCVVRDTISCSDCPKWCLSWAYKAHWKWLSLWLSSSLEQHSSSTLHIHYRATNWYILTKVLPFGHFNQLLTNSNWLLLYHLEFEGGCKYILCN